MFIRGLGVSVLRLALLALALPISQPRVDSPQPGDVLQGTVPIIGSTDLAGFQSAEVWFAYEADPPGGWFLIHQSTEAVADGTLADWDTTTITDGNYRLKVVVFVEGGEPSETLVEGLRVRNYQPVETDTPGVAPTAPAQEASAPTATWVVPTPTALAANPAQVNAARLTDSLLKGVFSVVVGFVALGLYQLLSAFWRRH
ncbi:MAG: hypothetical protein GYA59_14710 [Chloroflexi bacterium]|nr:hypothetical protein [Chloroflexota bacterium]